jgi:transcriptional regulator with XRE-family HTH domain
MSEKSKNNIGDRLATMREKLNLTQEEVAEELGIPRSGVSLIESGDRGIKIEEIKQYSKILHTKIEKLMEPVKPEEKKEEPSENQTAASTNAFFPMIEEVLATLGVPQNKCTVETNKVLTNAKINLVKANIIFHMPLTDQNTRQGMVDMVEEIHAAYPASKPVLEIDHKDIAGTHVLSFLTIPE